MEWAMKYLYNVRPGEVWWSAADLGWVCFSLSDTENVSNLLISKRLSVNLTDVMLHY
jgi:hypothetical protein